MLINLYIIIPKECENIGYSIGDFVESQPNELPSLLDENGMLRQPDTKNTINPALHVGVPAFRGTRNTRIAPLLNYDDEFGSLLK